MTSKATILKQLQTNKTRLAEDFHIRKIGLFGSYSKGQPGPKSDIDLVFELEEGEKMGFKELIELEDFFKNLFDVDQIDLVNQAYINPIVAFDIEKSVIYV